MKLIAAILALPLAALALDPTLPVARVVDGSVVETRNNLPTRWANTYPYHAAEYRWQDDGWRQYVACPTVAGSNATVTGYTITEDTATAICDYAAIPAPQPFADLDQQLDQTWPLLADHPAPADVPVDGMTYRLDGDPITWWIVRRNDLIATQLSAHDEQGNPIVRTVNLLTGEDETINLRQIVNARNFNDLNSAAKRSTNAAIKARAGR